MSPEQGVHKNVGSKGWSGDPARWDDLAKRYRDFAAGILPSAQVDESIAMIAKLETLPNISELIATLQPR